MSFANISVTGVVLTFFQPVICCARVFTSGCNSAKPFRFFPKKLNLKPFANVVIQFGRKVEHVTMSGSFPKMVSGKTPKYFWEKFGQCVVSQHCDVKDPLNPSLWAAVNFIQVGLWLQSQS